MIINNPQTGEAVENKFCKGCYCHDMAVTFGLTNGCCNECGCPKNLEGFEHYKKQNPDCIKVRQ